MTKPSTHGMWKIEIQCHKFSVSLIGYLLLMWGLWLGRILTVGMGKYGNTKVELGNWAHKLHLFCWWYRLCYHQWKRPPDSQRKQSLYLTPRGLTLQCIFYCNVWVPIFYVSQWLLIYYYEHVWDFDLGPSWNMEFCTFFF